MLEAALELARLGFSVFPCRPGMKTPRVAKGFLVATQDEAQIRKWWAKSPNGNVAVAAGEASGFWALDVDVSNEAAGVETLSDLMATHGQLPETARQVTGRGGYHYLFAWSPGVRNRAKFAPGLDVRGEGGYILVAPSRLTGSGIYGWVRHPGEGIAPAPEWLLKRITDHGKEYERPTVPITAPRRPHTGNTPYGEAALQQECDRIRNCPPGAQNETLYQRACAIGSLAAGGAIEPGYARDSLVAAGLSMVNGDARNPWVRPVVEKMIERAMAYAATDPRHVPQLKVVSSQAKPAPSKKASGHPQPKLATNRDDWMKAHDWIRNEEGNLKAGALWNIRLMIEHHPSLLAMFRYDEWGDRVIVERGVPGDFRTDYPRELTDHDEVHVAAWVNLRGVAPGISVAGAVIREVATRNPFNPMKTWLEGLEWDGVERVQTWLPKYAGTPDTDYERTVGRKFMIAAVARALAPGCKCDTMLVLEGPQGIRKSTLMRVLCGADYFTDQIGDITNKDSAQVLQGRWVVEVPEMDKFIRVENAALKDFLARQEDRYRPSYGRNVVTRPRRCVFVGTINPIEGHGYIKDPTGARRFWPVKCSKIDLNQAFLDREQLWAEALDMWRSGQSWWVDEDESDIVKSEQEGRIETDIWETKIAEWAVGKRGYYTSSEILREVIGMELSRQTQREKLRIASIFTRMGSKSSVQRLGGAPTRCYGIGFSEGEE